MSEWRELRTLQDVAAAQAKGEEIEVHLDGLWRQWNGDCWFVGRNYRARPRTDTVTVRKALFTFGCVYECTEEYATKNKTSFVCWVGDPVTYPKGGA